MGANLLPNYVQLASVPYEISIGTVMEKTGYPFQTNKGLLPLFPSVRGEMRRERKKRKGKQ